MIAISIYYKVLYRTIAVCYTVLNIFVRLLLVRVQLFRAVDSSIRMLLGVGISVADTTKLSSSSVKRWAPMSHFQRYWRYPLVNGTGFKLRLTMITQDFVDGGSQTVGTSCKERIKACSTGNSGSGRQKIAHVKRLRTLLTTVSIECAKTVWQGQQR